MLRALNGRAEGLGRAAAPEGFHKQASTSYDLLERLDARTLEGHSGCVNTVSFTQEGDILLSGSDDQAIILWDWMTGVCEHQQEGE